MVSKKIIEYTINKTINTVKCSDGTSLGKLKESFTNFNKKYGSLEYETLSIFDENGKEVYHTDGNTHSVSVSDKDESDLYDNGYKDLNVNHNHPSCYENNVPTYLSKGDTENLLTKKDGKYLYRSISATAANGSTMTVLRNNKFDSSNEKDYNKACRLMIDVSNEYYSRFKDNTIEYMVNKAIDYQNNTGKTIKASTFKQEAENHVFNEMGSLKQHFDKYGVFNDFEKCNAKLRITWVK